MVRAETLRQAVESGAVRPGDVTVLPAPRNGLLARLGLRHHKQPRPRRGPGRLIA